MSKWDKYGMAIAELASTMSKDPSTQVGAYIRDKDNRPVSTGFNGLPKGIKDDPVKLANREWKYAAIIHAERNAILFAERDRLIGSTLYVTHPPCGACASMIIQVGITKVVINHCDEDFKARWGTLGIELLKEAGVEVVEHETLDNSISSI